MKIKIRPLEQALLDALEDAKRRHREAETTLECCAVERDNAERARDAAEASGDEVGRECASLRAICLSERLRLAWPDLKPAQDELDEARKALDVERERLSVGAPLDAPAFDELDEFAKFNYRATSAWHECQRPGGDKGFEKFKAEYFCAEQVRGQMRERAARRFVIGPLTDAEYMAWMAVARAIESGVLMRRTIAL
jgi:hypothetical protein